MTIQLSKLLHAGEFGQFMTNRRTVLTVCRFNGYRSELGGGSTIVWRESGTVDHLHGTLDHHRNDVSALRLERRVPNLRRAANGATYWTIAGYRARIECRRRPNSQDEEWKASIHREDGSWKCNIEYNMYGIPRTMPDGSDFDLVWSHDDVDRERQAIREIDKMPDPDHKDKAPHQHGVAATLGHLQSNGGLRGHSVGDVFPYVPFYKGASCEQWVRCPDGTEEGPFSSIAAMHQFIEMNELVKEQERLPVFTEPVLQMGAATASHISVTPESAEQIIEVLEYIGVPPQDMENIGVIDDTGDGFYSLREYLDIVDKSNKLLED
ncbi:hypothetical protein ABMA84_15710 [Halobacteriovorax sp. XZX-2]|uniref:hypothetical protein n=2 Tax=unclassified Halobacteriovorax TaxID=2639665 RepID=UPI00371D13F7